MRLLGLLGAVAFTLASGVVGVCLLLLARRTRQAPDLAMGLAFVVAAAVVFPLLTAASVIGLDPRSAGLARTVMTLGTFFSPAAQPGSA